MMLPQPCLTDQLRMSVHYRLQHIVFRLQAPYCTQAFKRFPCEGHHHASAIKEASPSNGPQNLPWIMRV